MNINGLIKFDALKPSKQIRWESYGEVDVETARVFAELLLSICDVADQINEMKDEIK